MDVSSLVAIVGGAVGAALGAGGLGVALVKRGEARDRGATDERLAWAETDRALAPKLMERLRHVEGRMDTLAGKLDKSQDEEARCKADLYDLTARFDRSMAETLAKLDRQSARVAVLEERSANCAYRTEPGAACAGSDPPEAGEK